MLYIFENITKDYTVCCDWQSIYYYWCHHLREECFLCSGLLAVLP